MGDLERALLLAALAGAAIPAGGLAARIDLLFPTWMRAGFRHTVMAFGGGVLISAVALVLVPEGMAHLPLGWVLATFFAGGLAFFALDRVIERRGAGVAQLLAMLADFVPESLALGALLANDPGTGLLLALLIALQNVPEGFNAAREIRHVAHMPAGRVLAAFCAISLLGPLSAWVGFEVLRDHRGVLGGVMLFAAGGILYLIFQDIAPRVPIRRRWAPPLGVVGGFGLGLAGQALLG